MRVRVAATCLTLVALVLFGAMLLDLSGWHPTPDVRQYQTRSQPSPPEAAPEPPALAWELPPNWQELSGAQASQARVQIERLGVLGVPTTDAAAPPLQLVVTAMSGTAGGLASNVNRWRRQTGLAPLPAEEAANSLQQVTSPAGTVYWIFLSSPERPEQAMLVAILPQPGRSVFGKVSGPAAELQAARDDFLAWCRSLHHHATGASDE